MQPRVFGLIHDAHPTATKLFDNPVVGDVLADEPVGSATVPPVDQELLLRNEYLAAENRILKAQIKGRLLLSQKEKATSTQTFRDFREAQFRKVKLEKSQEHLHGNDPSPQKRGAHPKAPLFLSDFSTCFLQLTLAGRNTADGVRNLVFGSSVVTWKRSNRPFPFPPPLPLSNVRRYWLLRCIWISSKYGLRLMGSPKSR